ncbi:MAG TPA: winged helix-turn-helix domain-containing protein [Bryobacteraceae bacterium]|nr:winged helix-turn-helix domain-containing protein [Bryobacteraceae bacterium]
MKTRRFQFGPFHLDATDQLLLRDGKPLPLTPKAFETLAYLVENPVRLVTREELIKAIWPNSFVEDGSLSVNISLVRRTLGEIRDGEPYIETVPRKGYRFRSEVKKLNFEVPPQVDDLSFRAVGDGRIASASTTLPDRGTDYSLRPVTMAQPGRLILLGLMAVALLVAFFLWMSHIRRNSRALFASMKISRLTWHGQIADAAISPDGKYVAYVLNGQSGQSLWIRQVEVPGNIRLIAPQNTKYTSLVFSPDNNFLYYTKTNKESLQILCRMPFLGGDSKMLLTGLTGPISFSPDGRQLAFLRLDPVTGEASLMVANADGSGLHRIARRRRPRYFSPNGLAWLPDGRAIACFAGAAADYGLHTFHLVKVTLASGAEQALTSRTWSWAGPITSSSDGNNLLLAASEQAEDALQIWRVSLPSGEVSSVTNDLDNYLHLSSSSNGRNLAAVQVDKSADVWVAPADDLPRAAPLPSGHARGLNDVTWTSDGLIAYSARTGDYFGIFTTDSSGELLKQLTLDPGNKTESTFTRDGRYVLYQSAGKIWRLNRDGTAPRQLTFGMHDVHPSTSPDSRTVVYASFVQWSPSIGGKPTLWEVPIDGGKPIQLTTMATSVPQFSPDGNLIAAAYYPDGDPRFSRTEIAIFPSNGGPPIKTFERAGTPGADEVSWSPDGSSLDYDVKTADVGNLWRQSLRGGLFQLTHFSSDQLFDFAWSLDGKHLALARGKSLSDVVLIRDWD